MDYQYIPYIWPLLISGLMTFCLGVFSLIRFRKSISAVSFASSMFIVTLWSIPNALEMSAITLPVKLFWANIQYFAYCFSPVALLVLCLKFIRRDKKLTRGRLLVLLLIPTIITLLVWTDRYHGLIRHNIYLDYSGTFPVIRKSYGIAFYVHAAYAHLLNFTTLLLLFRAAFSLKMIYRKQVIALLTGVCMIVLPNILYILQLGSIRLFDITPVFFGPAGLLIFWSIFRYRMFDLVPLAWETVIRTMDAGVVVMDLQNRILDANQTFVKIMDRPWDRLISHTTAEVSIEIPEFGRACSDWSVTHSEFTVPDRTGSRIYEILLSSLRDKEGSDIGRLAVIHEITEKKRLEQEYLKQQWKLVIKEERERIVSEMHDNLGQVLEFLNDQVQDIRSELKDNRSRAVGIKLDRLIDVTQATNKELREYMYEVKNSEPMEERDFLNTIKMELGNYTNQNNGTAIEGKPSENLLTDRQREVLELVSAGKTYKEIGEALGLTERTVKYHMGRIIELLQLENKSQLIAYAALKGILQEKS